MPSSSERGRIIRSAIVAFIADFDRECECGPSLEWIAYGVSRSKTAIHNHLTALLKSGEVVMTKVKHHDSRNGYIWLYSVTAQARAVLEAQR
jgi:predicted transcriptional regulator